MIQELPNQVFYGKRLTQKDNWVAHYQELHKVLHTHYHVQYFKWPWEVDIVGFVLQMWKLKPGEVGRPNSYTHRRDLRVWLEIRSTTCQFNVLYIQIVHLSWSPTHRLEELIGHPDQIYFGYKLRCLCSNFFWLFINHADEGRGSSWREVFGQSKPKVSMPCESIC